MHPTQNDPVLERLERGDDVLGGADLPGDELEIYVTSTGAVPAIGAVGVGSYAWDWPCHVGPPTLGPEDGANWGCNLIIQQSGRQSSSCVFGSRSNIYEQRR
jgi:hypothetical protein